jgi:hypothetical protein
MAVLFDDASSERLTRTYAATQSVPLTMAGWFYLDTNLTQTLLLAYSTSDNKHYHRVWYSNGNLKIYASSRKGFGEANSGPSGSALSLNTWYHCAGVFAGNSSRTVYLDGSAATENTENFNVKDPTNLCRQ